MHVFAQFSGEAEPDTSFESYVLDLWTDEASRPEWCFVAEEEGRIVGRIGYWALPGHSCPDLVDFLLLPWDGPYVTIGGRLLNHTLALFRAQGADAMNCQVNDPSPLYPYPARCAETLEQVGFQLRREGDRWEWTPDAPRGSATARQRLVYRHVGDVGDEAFIDAIRRVTEGTLDCALQDDIERFGPESAARRYFDDARTLRYIPEWWNLAYTKEGRLVGLIMAAENDGGPIIDYVGVVPEQRGHGYADDLLTRGIDIMRSANALRIRADTDRRNVPMANAFRRAGFARFCTRLDYRIDPIPATLHA